MSVLAVIFDFDDTLLPDSTSALLRAHGLDANEFWTKRTRELVDQGYDPPLAYLNLLLREVGPGKPLGELTAQHLREFGASLDASWFPGLPQLFEDLRFLAGEHRDVSIEFYIISGGLQSIIEGGEYVKKYFTGVYGCQLGDDATTGLVKDVKRCVTFTEKTRFLFEINKGISPSDAATQPHLVNQLVPEKTRPVPFRNMIYVGDGLTDIPCFSLIDKGGGTAFGVFQSGKESAKQAFQRFLETKRVRSMHHPDYRDDAELGSLLRAAVSTACSNIMIQAARAV
jgi:phosphoglycolate phosphatase-like HAD superfamily hydrolase